MVLYHCSHLSNIHPFLPYIRSHIKRYITEAAVKLRNYRALGPDGVPNELVKYA